MYDRKNATSTAATRSDLNKPHNQPTLPAISLPKGGGAIRGIDEKFSANLASGTGSLSVPIYTSPGRSGFGPQLSLSYDSGSGNGPFGFGWSLSLPSITRKSDKGLPRYQDEDESDVFILSGAEDLVPVFKKDSNGDWIRDSKGNLIFDEEERNGYMVRRYRPRIEGLFARIERWIRKNDGDIHWRSISKDNILTVYGKDLKSRIADPMDQSRVFSWLICESYDDKGNAIVYEYAAENYRGVDLSQANERNRVRNANRYLKRILYGNRQPVLLDIHKPGFRKSHTEQKTMADLSSADWMFEVVFEYSDWKSFVAGRGPQTTLDEKRISISFPPGSNAAGNSLFGAGYQSTWFLRGDFDVQVDYELLDWPLNNGVRIAIASNSGIFWGDATERLSDAAHGGEVYLAHYATTKSIGTSDKLGSLRMKRSGDRLTGYYKDSDGKWVELHSERANVVGDTHISLQAWGHRHPPEPRKVHVVFDNFVINKGKKIIGEQHLLVEESALALGGSRGEEEEEKLWPVRPDPFSTYRAGFEVRTYRRCHRVLIFHRFPDELGSEPYLVHSTEFDYSDLAYNNNKSQQQPSAIKEELEHQGSTRFASFLQSVIQSGYVRVSDQAQSMNAMNENGAKYHTYIKKSLPPVEFEYSQPRISEKIEEIDAASSENLPIGLDGIRYQWVDLDGEGVSGVLTEQGDAWFYKPNLGDGKFGPIERVALKPSIGDLNGSEHRLIDLAGDGQLDLVELSGPTPGFYERSNDQRWKSFVPFVSLPNIDWKDPNLRFVDLTGDGHADVLITENEAFTWYPSLAERGFGPSAAVNSLTGSQDEERGPKLVFSDRTQSIYLADMSGDGLTDLVRIRNGEICYWPNIGYGRFGPKVTMDNSPWFDAPDMFDQARIRLADIDGSGVTDIIYIGHGDDGVRLYFNQSGNSWRDPVLLTHFPHIDNISSVTALDLLGNGTACLVWSSPLPSHTRRPMRYVDLMGGQKPHLLILIKNNMGAETHVEYASSTRFYLADKAAGKPWVTKLPFPVHVVERIKTYDRISRNRFVSRYTYHHGYFDGIEREFRGFGMVEQYDTEEFATLSSNSEVLLTEDNIEASSHVPPVLTKTWFHTGIYLGRDHVSNFFAGMVDAHDRGEYYREPAWQDDDNEAKKHLLEDTSLPARLTIEEEREACRALKGSMLRQEVYALDDTPKAEHPYTVTEQNFASRRLQPQGENNHHAVFFTHARESINYHYERNPADPRIFHTLTLEVDNFGNVLKQASVGYGRRQSDHNPLLLPVDNDKQTQQLISYTENRMTNAIDDADSYRTPLLCESCTYELRGYTPRGAAGRFQLADFVQPDSDNPNVLIHIFDREINYEDRPIDGKQRRLIEQVRTLYRKNDLTALLSLGELESLALQGESYKLAFTPGLLSQVFQRAGQPLMMPNDPTRPNNPANILDGEGADRGGYVSSQQLKAEGKFLPTDPNDYWWIPSGRVFYSPNSSDTVAQELDYASRHFFLPNRYRDPFHTNTVTTESFVTFDTYDLLILETRDAVGNRVTVGERLPNGQINPSKPGNDYRVLQPRLVTDPNRNRMEIAFDTLGMVAGTAVKGKDDSVGDTLTGFEPDLTQAQIDGFYDASDPHEPAPSLLNGATTRIIYDLHRFRRTQEAHPEDPTKWLPVYAATLARESHVSDALPSDGLRIQISFSYSDGFGREIQKKIQAEPGPLVEGGLVVNPRWIGSGWTVFNNKGKPVRLYEPFFSQLAPEKRHHFEFGMQVGESPILFYDPLERVVATLHPNHTYEKVVFDPWQQVSFDVNDTVAAHDTQTGDPRTDLEIQGYVAKYFAAINDSTTWRTWLEQRQSGAMGTEERTAADKAAAHANTPAVTYFDVLGRPFLTIVHNRFEHDGTTVDETYATRVELDIEGNQREVRDAILQNGDAQGRIVMRYNYDMLGNRIYQLSMEAGARWILNDVAGKPIRTWDSRGHVFRTEYDPVRRPLRSFVMGADSTNPNQELLTERMVYGEQHPEDEQRNLRGKLYLHLDQAGVVTTESHDFKGNALHSSRRLAKQYKQAIDWRAVDNDHLEVLEAAMPPILETETFTGRTTYDALNRPIQIIFPHSSRSGTKVNVTQPVYNEANLLERVDAWLELDAEPTAVLNPNTAIQQFIRNIDYNAKGQRKLIEYGNGVNTSYEYDPLTFRLTHLQTLRSGDDSGVEKLQDLFYFYDPVGNIVSIDDRAQQTIFFSGQVVKPDSEYTYDAIYRLIEAIGREHIGQASQPHTTWDDKFRIRLAHPNDGQKMRNYLELYEYDEVGNILSVDHKVPDNNSNNWIGNWIRTYEYDAESLIEQEKNSNRLSSTTVGGMIESYKYDLHGNIERMPHLANHADPDEPNMHWDFKDQLNQVDLGGGGTAYYVYDAGGQRIRKVHEHIGALLEERIYLGNFEVYRKHNGNSLKLERETLHMMDDKQRIALVEARTIDIVDNDPAPQQLIRYQLSNHLGSASLELDDQAQIISYEEYAPFGSTSYNAVRSQTETPKRYRYTGRERDEETGFNYHVERYYMPWLGRWISSDPEGLEDGPSVYAYARDNPIRLVDTMGAQSSDPNQLWLSQSPVYHQQVTATATSRGITDRVRANLQKVAEMWGQPGPIDASHLDKPFAHMRAGETGRVFAESRHLNRARAAVERAETAMRRAIGLFTRDTSSVDPTAKKGVRYGQPPEAPAFQDPKFKDWKSTPGPAAMTATKSQTSVSAVASAEQLELPFNKPGSAISGTEASSSASGLTGRAGQGVSGTGRVTRAARSTVSAGGRALRATTNAARTVARTAAPVLRGGARVLGVVARVAAPIAIAESSARLATATNNLDRLQAGADTLAGAAAYAGPVGTAFSVGYGAGQLLDYGVEAATGESLSSRGARGMERVDRAVSSLLPENRSQPEYKRENRIAWWLIDTFNL